MLCALLSRREKPCWSLPSIAVAILLVISAFFSGSETALTAVSRGRMHQLEKDGSRAAGCVNRLVENRERLIGALLLGNTFINILASSLMTAALEAQLGQRAVAITTALMTVVILVFAEVMPKTLAIARTDRFALFVARPLRLVVSMLAPIVATVQWLVWRVLSLFGVGARGGSRRPRKRMTKSAARSNCITAKAMSSASIAT